MAAHFVLTLVTQPPHITVGEPEKDGYTILVPYTLDKPELIEALARPAGETDIVGEIAPDAVLFTLTTPWVGGSFVFTARDDVWNQSTVTIPYGFRAAPLVIERRDGQPGPVAVEDDLAFLGKAYSRGPLFKA